MNLELDPATGRPTALSLLQLRLVCSNITNQGSDFAPKWKHIHAYCDGDTAFVVVVPFHGERMIIDDPVPNMFPSDQIINSLRML